jgi:hypothetical protein
VRGNPFLDPVWGVLNRVPSQTPGLDLTFYGMYRTGDFVSDLYSDIRGSNYTFNLYLTGDGASVTARLIHKRGAQESELAQASWTVNSSSYLLYTSTVTGLDPNAAAGDQLILRITINTYSTVGGISWDGSSYPSHVVVPPGAYAPPPRWTPTPTNTP